MNPTKKTIAQRESRLKLLLDIGWTSEKILLETRLPREFVENFLKKKYYPKPLNGHSTLVFFNLKTPQHYPEKYFSELEITNIPKYNFTSLTDCEKQFYMETSYPVEDWKSKIRFLNHQRNYND